MKTIHEQLTETYFEIARSVITDGSIDQELRLMVATGVDLLEEFPYTANDVDEALAHLSFVQAVAAKAPREVIDLLIERCDESSDYYQ